MLETREDPPPAPRLRNVVPAPPILQPQPPIQTVDDGPIRARDPIVYPGPSSLSALSQQRTADDTGRATPGSNGMPKRAALGPDGTAELARGNLPVVADPTTIGRYTILRRLGAGSMGVVYAAFDQELDRRVAIKVVKPRTHPSRDQDLRVLREAQALAKLSHPNVVQIYEVGEFRGQTFLAMEFVQGKTLREWLAARPQSWQEIIGIVSEAGRGLAAAHAAGMVHRDFKPDNVLVGNDHRPRVLDFGLVRGDAHELPAGAEEDAGTDTAIAHWQHFQLTRLGVIVGTPAYMSPEQLAGLPADARSDQFNFCATLYEALHGYRPFQGMSVAELRDAINRHALVAPPRSTCVPQWTHRALLRGLSHAPSERWPTMDALLTALARDPRQAWFRGAGVIGALALAGGASYGAAVYQTAEAQMCSGVAAELANVWGEDRRQAVHAGFTALSGPLGAAALERIFPRLDAYTDAWTAMRTEACETHRRAEQSDVLYDLRTRCLHDRRLGLQATVDLLQEPNATVVEKAVELVAGLEPLATCADPEALAAVVPPPDDPQTAAAVAVLEDRLPAVEARTRAGQYDLARAASTELLHEAGALGYMPLIARLALTRGNVEMEGSQPDAAARDFERASSLAIEHGLPDVAAEALAKQIFVEGTLQAKTERALALASVAGAFAYRAQEPLRARALLHNNLGTVHGRREEWDQALAEYLRAVDLWEAVPGAELELAATLNNIGLDLARAGRPVESRAPLERAIELRTSMLGAGHPQTLSIRVNLGIYLHQVHDFRGALALLQDVIPQLRTAVGEHHEFTIQARYLSGLVHRDLGDLHAAASAFTAVAEAYRDEGETSFQLGQVLLEAGRTQNMLARPADATAACNAAERLFSGLPAGSPQPTERTLCLAEAAFLEGDLQHAQELALRALPHIDVLPPDLRGLARYLLARTSAQLDNRSPAEIRALATAAAEDMRAIGPAYYPEREALAAWLVTLP